MGSEFKQCPRGHYYQGSTCPYCKPAGNNQTQRTELFVGNQDPTETIKQGGPSNQDTIDVLYGNNGGKTTILNGIKSNTIFEGSKNANVGTTNRQLTQFGDDTDPDFSNGNVSEKGYRFSRKLVGWLVSYSFDSMGVDYKLYEGRNIIGRNMECNITVPDPMVSGEHAILLYRAGKYSITDKQSSHGTFVNNVDIELEPYYLNDGDVIRIGSTILKFRTAL